jgi:glycosyltransferase involved in cell wall biosynthesis
MRTVDANLVVVGDGPERSRLMRLAEELAPGRVAFVGAVADQERAAYYRAADVAVMPSVSPAEAFAIALLEAMVCGTPVVSTELGTGTSWLNQHRETGLVVPPRDPGALANALTLLLADRDLHRELGAGARRRSETHFSKRAMLRGLNEIYEAVLAGRRGVDQPDDAVGAHP